MLDSDNLPLRDPEALFDSAEYQRSGTLFFSDWWDIVEWVKPQAYKAFGLPYPGDNPALLAAESGQLLLNRRAAPTSLTRIVKDSLLPRGDSRLLCCIQPRATNV